MEMIGGSVRAQVRAPAKLNLFFEVLGKRDDGYHEIETLMVPISLHDSIVACRDESGQVRVSCRWAAARHASHCLGQLPAADENLATKAVLSLRRAANVQPGIRLQILKRIPTCSGMGGASSDAAAALLAANHVWGLDWPIKRLVPLAAELGSDVPFFLARGAAICRGRGERIEPQPGLTTLHLVVVQPPEGLSTASVYRQCAPATQPRHAQPLTEALRAGDCRHLKRLVHNRLETTAAAISPWINRLKSAFDHEDCLASQMTGSGSAYFGICRHAHHARRVANRLHSRGLGSVFAVSTSN